jgi:hypothetical protein
MNYPGQIVKKGSTNKAAVSAVQKRLTEMGCGMLKGSGVFGDQTHQAVILFQMRFPDQYGAPLKPDGQIGPLTWAALFGRQSIPVAEPASGLLKQALAIARTQVGITENPVGSNSGPEVNSYLKSVGLGKGFAWCAAFVYWCFNEAADKQGCENPLIKTAGVLDHWRKAMDREIAVVRHVAAKNNPVLVKPGMIFIMDYGSGNGHTGFVEKIEEGRLVTIEGNTNDGGSREGIGVFRRHGRKIHDINKGFIDYGS